MKKVSSFSLMICLGMLGIAGCATQAKTVRPDWQNPGHKVVGEQLVRVLRSSGRSPTACKVFFLETEELNAVSLGECRFGFTTGLVDTRDEQLIRGIAAHEVAHEVLGHADKRKAAIATEQVIRTAVSFIPGVGGLIATSAVLVAGMLALPAYSRSQEAEADDKAVEILRNATDPDPAGTMAHTFRTLLARAGAKGGGLLDTHPGTEDRLEVMLRLQREQRAKETSPPLATPRVSDHPVGDPSGNDLPSSSSPTISAESKARPERPIYTLGQRWIRSDGEYRLIRIDEDRYVFTAGADQEIHLTKNLMVAKMKKGGWATEFDPPATLTWPLEVGRRGTGAGNWQVPLDARKLPVRYTWSVEAYEEVRVAAGPFRAFRILLSWEPQATDVITTSSYPQKQLVSWYAPEVQQLVKAEYRDLGPLTFEVVSVDRFDSPRREGVPTATKDQPPERGSIKGSASRIEMETGTKPADGGAPQVTSRTTPQEIKVIQQLSPGMGIDEINRRAQTAVVFVYREGSPYSVRLEGHLRQVVERFTDRAAFFRSEISSTDPTLVGPNASTTPILIIFREGKERVRLTGLPTNRRVGIPAEEALGEWLAEHLKEGEH